MKSNLSLLSSATSNMSKTDGLNVSAIKLVVCDLDGTLLNHEHELTEESKKTIHELVAKGFQFMLATGRHYQDVNLLAAQIGVEMCLITSNGARVHDHEGKLLYENQLPEHLVQRVLLISNGFEVHRNIYQQEKWLVEEPHESLLAIHQASGFEYVVCDFQQIDYTSIDKIYFTASHETLLNLQGLLDQELGNQLMITFTSPEYLEVMNLGVSKGNALKMILQQRDLLAEQVMALGDGLNDKEMLALVGLGVVMSNASNSVKALFPNLPLADSHANNGVAKYLQNTLLNRDFKG